MLIHTHLDQDFMGKWKIDIEVERRGGREGGIGDESMVVNMN